MQTLREELTRRVFVRPRTATTGTMGFARTYGPACFFPELTDQVRAFCLSGGAD